MELKKYDRFRYPGGEIAEYIGMETKSGNPLLRIINSSKPGYVGMITFVTMHGLETLKKLPPSATHPVIKEVCMLLKEKPEQRHKLLDAMLVMFSVSSLEERSEVTEMLHDNLPESLKKEIRPGDLCKPSELCVHEIRNGTKTTSR